MILRRISEGIKNQDWFVVLVEVMIVVVGIFIGLQVDDWNEERKNASMGGAYVERLFSDIENDKLNAQQRIQYFSVVMSYGEQALTYLNQPSAERQPTAKMLIAFMLASSTWESYRAQVTFDELKNTGRFQLIGGLATRKVIDLYYGTSNQRQRDTRATAEYFHLIRSLIPPGTQGEILSGCEEAKGIMPVRLIINPTCEIELDFDVIASAILQIGAHPELKSELVFMISQIRFNMNLFNEQIVASEYALKTLLSAK